MKTHLFDVRFRVIAPTEAQAIRLMQQWVGRDYPADDPDVVAVGLNLVQPQLLAKTKPVTAAELPFNDPFPD